MSAALGAGSRRRARRRRLVRRLVGAPWLESLALLAGAAALFLVTRFAGG